MNHFVQKFIHTHRYKYYKYLAKMFHIGFAQSSLQWYSWEILTTV